MAGHEIIVIGASAGGVEALQELVGSLAPDFSAAAFVVLHMAADSPSVLPAVLGKNSRLPIDYAEDNAPIHTGRIYLAPPDRHLLLEYGQTRVVRGPKENRHRPAIDPLFRSAAWSYGPEVIGVVLTGYLDDGVAGLWAVKTCGGIAVVQDPADARVPDMPQNAMAALKVDYSLPVKEIGPLLTTLAKEPPRNGKYEAPERIKRELEFVTMQGEIGDMNELGTLSAYTCPSCRGPLWELRDGEIVRFRCYTGHAYSAESLLAGQGEAVEDALYSAIRALEEKANLSRRMARDFFRHFPLLESKHSAQAAEMDKQVTILRELIVGKKAAAAKKAKRPRRRAAK